MPLRVARPDRRWKGSCGRSLVPEPVWCEERQHPVGRCAWGVRLAADTRPGVHPATPPGHRGCANEPEYWQFSGELALGFEEEPGFSPAACVVLCPLNDLNTKNRTSPPATRPAVTTRQCKKTARVLPTFPPKDPESTPFSAASHTFLF